ncbi:MAG: DUF4249 family protein [Bacteroidales bacterium]|nr:DUF4249 family protein [Bacteroidales bacterium]MBN2819812.1 DUF4249 family protein [Bacteroidales bacterium]
MRYKIKSIWLLVIILLSSRCTKEIDIQLNDTNREMAMYCTFTEDNLSAFFSSTTQITNGEYPRLWKLHITLSEEAKPILDTIINDSVFKFKYDFNRGILYHIAVSDSSGSVLTGTAEIPEDVNIFSASLTLAYKKYSQNEISGIMYSEATITFIDPANEKNYYEIIIYDVNDNFSPEVYEYWSSFSSEDPVLKLEGDLDYNPKTIFFSDDLFNGEKYQLKVLSSDGGNYCSYGQCLPNEAKIELRSISEDYYLYLKYLTRHYYNQQTSDGKPGLDMLYTGEPIDVYSNIENGYGLFAGYSTITKDFVLVPINF